MLFSLSDTASTNTQIVGEADETAALPLVIKEGDVKYQFKRIVLYRRLLQCYPFQRPRIWTEARVDSLPQVIFSSAPHLCFVCCANVRIEEHAI